MSIRSIAIVLGDNDFGYTFRNLLATISKVISNDPHISSEQIEDIILEGVRFHYIAFQNLYNYRGGSNSSYEEQFVKTTEYLTTGLRILFDQDAEQEFEKVNHDGGAWLLCVQDGIITPF